MTLCPSCGQDAGDIAKFCPSCGTSITRAGLGDDLTGRVFAGKFRIERLLGEGGMGKVYRATQLSLDKTVVLKVLRSSLLSDARTVARFQREAKAASRLNHPNSIGVIDFGQSESGAMYIAMEYVSGRDLNRVLKEEGPLSEQRTVRIVSQALSALSDAHAAGVIHRDMKPENIMVEQRRGEPDFVKVLDFGIAKIQEAEAEEGPALTRAGFVYGTPEYMSPEQARGAALDARSDLYSIGVILYQCVTNLLPFDADSAVGLATMHLITPPEAPRRRCPKLAISEAMEALILKALSKDPSGRPQSAEDLRRELLSLAASAPAVTAASDGAPWQAPSGRTSSRATVLDPGPLDGSLTGERRPRARVKALAMAGAVALVAGLIGAGVLAYDRLVSRPKTLHAALEAIPEPEAAAPKPIDDAAAPSSGSREVAPADSARARELGDEARRAIASKDYDQALDLLSKAWDAAPAASTAKHLALCYLAKGDNASAARWLRQYLKDAGSASDVSYVERFLATNP